MAQPSQVETLDLSSSNDQSQSSPSSSSTDPSLSRNSSFSRLNAKAPEFVPTRNSQSTQTKTQVQVQVQVQQPPPPPRVVMPPPPPPAAAMIHPHPPSPHHVYPPHGTGAFHVIPVHHQMHHQHHVPVQNYHQQQHQHHRNHNHHHHRHQNHNNNSNNNNNHHQNNQYEDQQEGEVPLVKDKKDKKDHQHGGLNDESIQKVLNQVEYYFSDLNLATTDHLIRFILKDPEGYVPISTVASFKKIKAIVSSHSHLASVLRKSSKLFVSEDGKKIKRQNPLTESDLEELQSRIVVAENLPEDHCHQNLMKIFSAVGSVKTIRTCLPQTSGGGASSGSRSTKSEGMLFSNKLHAFVEYESVELAEKAIAELNDEGNWRSGLRVRLMLRRGSKPAQVKGKKGHEGEWQCEEEDASTSEQHLNEKQPDDSSQQIDAQSHDHTGEEHNNEKEGGQRKGRNKGRGKGRGRNDRGQYHNNSHHNNSHHNSHHNNHHNNRGHHVGTPPSNNMVNNEQPIIGKQPPGPRMPDGTRGFAMGRGKPVAVSTA